MVGGDRRAFGALLSSAWDRFSRGRVGGRCQGMMAQRCAPQQWRLALGRSTMHRLYRAEQDRWKRLDSSSVRVSRKRRPVDGESQTRPRPRRVAALHSVMVKATIQLPETNAYDNKSGPRCFYGITFTDVACPDGSSLMVQNVTGDLNQLFSPARNFRRSRDGTLQAHERGQIGQSKGTILCIFSWDLMII